MRYPYSLLFSKSFYAVAETILGLSRSPFQTPEANTTARPSEASPESILQFSQSAIAAEPQDEISTTD